MAENLEDHTPLFSTTGQTNIENPQADKKEKYRPSFFNPNHKPLLDDKFNSLPSNKNRSILKGNNNRKFNLLNV